MRDDCVFCKIALRATDTPILQENQYGVVVNDRAPVAAIHVLVLSKEHFIDMAAASFRRWTQEASALQGVMLLARDYAMKHIPNGYRVVINTGPDACQTVRHFHVHLLGGEKLKDL